MLLVVPTDTFYLFCLYLQERMLLAWQRLVQERPVPLLCQFCSLCWPHPRGFTALCSLLPGSWLFRSLSSLRPLALALVLSVVCGLIFSFSRQLTFLSLHIEAPLLFAAVIVGGIDMMSQSLVLAKKPHIVIGKTVEEGAVPVTLVYKIIQAFLTTPNLVLTCLIQHHLFCLKRISLASTVLI